MTRVWFGCSWMLLSTGLMLMLRLLLLAVRAMLLLLMLPVSVLLMSLMPRGSLSLMIRLLAAVVPLLVIASR